MKNKEMSFLGHLEELRWHIIRSFIAVIILAIFAFIYSEFIFDNIILFPKNPEFFTNRMFCKLGHLMGTEKLCINSKSFQIININMSGQFVTHIKISMVVGIIASFPYIFFEFWNFIKPALEKKEKKYTTGAVFFTSILFMMGVLFGYFLIVPLSLNFLGSYVVSDQVLNQINIGSYIDTITSVTLAAGIIFELPVLIYFLSKFGIVTPSILRKYRRHSLVIILSLSAIITPPDIFSQILVSLPLFILYEFGILIAKNIYKEKEEQ